jgi:hypothetical protein
MSSGRRRKAVRIDRSWFSLRLRGEIGSWFSPCLRVSVVGFVFGYGFLPNTSFSNEVTWAAGSFLIFFSSSPSM